MPGTTHSFPLAIVIALALGGFYRSNRRAPYESSFSELKELAIALCAGCVISIGLSVVLHSTFDIAESNATQLFLATIVVMALISRSAYHSRRVLAVEHALA